MDPLFRRAVSQLEALEKQNTNDTNDVNDVNDANDGNDGNDTEAEAGPSSSSAADNSDMDVQTEAAIDDRLPSIHEEADALWSDVDLPEPPPEVLQPYQE